MEFEKVQLVKSSGNYMFMVNEKEDFIARLAYVNYVEIRRKMTYPKHTHILYELLFILRGTYRCELDGERLTVRAGELLIVQPGQEHEDHLLPGCVWYGLHFNLIPAESGRGAETIVFSSESSPGAQIVRGRDLKRFRKDVERIFGELSDGDGSPERFWVANSLFSAAFRKILLCCPKGALQHEPPGEKKIDPEVARIHSVFARNLTRSPSIRELCGECSMSRSSFFRLCHAVFRKPPKQSFLHCKIMHIQQFIRENPCASVKELSSIFGFKNQFHFSRVFKKETGFFPNYLIRKKKNVLRRVGNSREK